MEMPDNLQVDNAMSFYGGRKYPRGMGPLIRLCLHQGIEPWFIPVAEPWRNGMIEKFIDRYQEMFLQKKIMTTEEELHAGSLAFEQRHNGKYRYSKLKGKTPLKALADSKAELRFPKPPELQYEYVIATINVKEQKLKLFLNKTQVEEFNYKLR